MRSDIFLAKISSYLLIMFVGLFFDQKYCEFLFFCNFIENIKILILAKI